MVGLMTEGQTNGEIAASLGLGTETIKTHLSRCYAKLGVRNRTEATRLIVSLKVAEGGINGSARSSRRKA